MWISDRRQTGKRIGTDQNFPVRLGLRQNRNANVQCEVDFPDLRSGCGRGPGSRNRSDAGMLRQGPVATFIPVPPESVNTWRAAEGGPVGDVG